MSNLSEIPVPLTTTRPITFMTLPIDAVIHIMSMLDHEDVIKVRRSCSALNKLFIFYRSRFDGPKCDARIRYIEGQLDLQVRCGTGKWPARAVSLNNWKYEFQNSTCYFLEISTDTAIPDILIKKILCCSKIYHCKYEGNLISTAWAAVLSNLVCEKFEVKVEDWTNTGTCPRMEIIQIGNNIEGLSDIVELAKAAQDMTVCINFDNFERSLDKLKIIKSRSIQISEWTFIIKNVPLRPIHPFLNKFGVEIGRIAKHEVSYGFQNYGLPSSMIIRVVEYGT